MRAQCVSLGRTARSALLGGLRRVYTPAMHLVAKGRTSIKEAQRIAGERAETVIFWPQSPPSLWPYIVTPQPLFQRPVARPLFKRRHDTGKEKLW